MSLLLLLRSQPAAPAPAPVPTIWTGVITEQVGTYSNGDHRLVVRVNKTFTGKKFDAVTVAK